VNTPPEILEHWEKYRNVLYQDANNRSISEPLSLDQHISGWYAAGFIVGSSPGDPNPDVVGIKQTGGRISADAWWMGFRDARGESDE
jgi:hypothetical protein